MSLQQNEAERAEAIWNSELVDPFVLQNMRTVIKNMTEVGRPEEEIRPLRESADAVETTLLSQELYGVVEFEQGREEGVPLEHLSTARVAALSEHADRLLRGVPEDDLESLEFFQPISLAFRKTRANREKAR